MKTHHTTTSLALAAALLFATATATAQTVDVNVSGSTLAGAITLASGVNSFTTDAGMTGTLSGVVSGAADATLVKLGGGLLTLTAAPTYNGPTHVLSGTLRFMTTPIAFNMPGNIVDGAGSTLWIDGQVRVGHGMTASLEVRNGAKLIQGANPFYIGYTPDADGTLIATGAGSEIRAGAAMYVGSNTGRARVEIANGAVLAVAGALNLGQNSSTGRLDILNGGTVTAGAGMQIAQLAGAEGALFVSGTNSTLTVNGGAVTIGANGTGTLSITNGGAMTIAGNALNPVGTAATSTALIIIDGATSRLSANAVGGGNGFATFKISNGGQLLSSGNFSTTAKTVVMLGNGGLISGTSALTMSGTLMGSGSFVSTAARSVTVAATGALAPGVLDSAGIGELFIGGTLAFNGGTLRIDTAAGGLSDKLLVDGDLLFSAARGTIDIGAFNMGSFDIVTTTGTIGDITGVFDTNSIKVNGAAPSSRQGVGVSVVDDNKLRLELTAMNYATAWTNNSGNNTWNTSAAGTNWSATLDPTMLYFMDGDFVTFDAAHSGTINIAVNVTVSGMNVDGNYRFTGGSITGDTSARMGVAATGRLNKTGAGTLAFANAANDFRGGINIDGGLVTFTNGNQIATTGTTLSFSNSGTLRPAADALTLGNTLEIAAGAAAVIDTDSRNLTHTGALAAASSGTLVKTGAGTLTLAGDSSANSGAARVNAGTLALAPGARLRADTTIATGRLLLGAGASLLGNATAAGAASSIAATGTITGNVALSSGALLRIGGDALLAPASLNIGGNLSVANSTLTFDFINGANCLLNIAGSVTATGSNTINIGASSLTSGTYTLGNIGDIMNSATIVVTIDNTAQSTASRTRASVSRDTLAPSNLLLSYGMDASRRMTWNLPGSGAWNASSENWSGDGQTVFQNGDTVVFSTAAANAAISIENVTPRVSDMLVNNTGTLAFTGLGIFASATTANGAVLAAPTGKLVKTGAGALVLDNAANHFEGGIDIGTGAAGVTGGLLVFNRPDQLGVGAGATLAFKNNGTLMPGAAFDTSGTLAINIDIHDNTTGAINTAGHTVSYSGALRAFGANSVLQKTGAGTLRLLGDNSDYVGTTDITEGAVQLAGATLGGTIHVRSGASLAGWGFATGADSVHVWSGGIIMPSSATNALRITNLVFEQNSTLTGHGVLDGAATINAGVTVLANIAASNTVALAGTLTGENATLVKTGDGDLRLGATSSAYIATVTINQGALVLAAGSQTRIKTAMNINEGATLRAAGNTTLNLDATAVLANHGAIEVGRAAGAAIPYSTLTINGGRYVGAHGANPTGGVITLFVSNTLVGGTQVLADKVVFGPDTVVSGTTWIEIKRPAIPALFSMSEMPDLVEVQGMAMPGTLFKSDEIGQAGSTHNMWFEWTPGSEGQWTQVLAAEIPLMTGLDASSMLSGKASLDALGHRLRSLHYDKSPFKFELWVNGLYRDDKVKTSRYDNVKAGTRGIQAGAGWMRSKDNNRKTALAGLYFDYSATRMKRLDGGTNSTQADAHGLGVYGSIKNGSWYLDGIARYSKEDYTVSIKQGRARGDFGTKGNGYLIAVQTGAVLTKFLGYNMEPNLRLAWQRHALDATTDTLGRVYDIHDADSAEARAGISLWDQFKFQNGLKYWPRVGLSATYEFKNRSVMEVRGSPQRFINNTRGFGTLLDIGLVMQLSRRINLDLGLAWQHNDSLENLYFNAGIGCRW